MSRALFNQPPMQQAAHATHPAATDPLADLHDIHLPEAIGWWPLAPGWWLLLGFIIMLLAALLFYRRWRKIQKNRPVDFSTEHVMKAAMLEFASIEQRHLNCKEQTDDHARQTVADISQLLRRCAVQLARINNDSQAIAGITGDDWLNWLDQQWERDDFMQGAGRILTEAPYRKLQNSSPDSDRLQDLFNVCRLWLEKKS